MANRILTTHAGALPRSEGLRDMVIAKAEGKPHDEQALSSRLREEVAAVVRKQAGCGLDSVNDGELSKTSFTNYVRERLAGFEIRQLQPGEAGPMNITARDQKRFGEYFKVTRGFGWSRFNAPQVFCNAPLQYVGQAALQQDIDNFKAALKGVKVAEAYLPANTPGTIEHWLRNSYYKDAEEFVYAIAEVMREEYNAIVEAGFLLQIDDPDLPDGWQMYPDMTVAQYRRYAIMRVDALNHALRDIPREKIRLHVCWGSFHGPHAGDIPLKDIVDIIFRVKASSYSIEASNPMHEHEYQVFAGFKLPKDAILIPGVVGHCTDFIEHPELVADRLIRYAKLVGAGRVMGGTDCGLGPRVGHAEIAWAKLESLARGAQLASKRLFAKAAKPAAKKKAAAKKPARAARKKKK